MGSLFVNPGGPGAPGTGLPVDPRLAPLAQQFDLVGFDPRGVGGSTPTIRCAAADDLVAQADRARIDRDPATALPRGLDAGRAFAESCVASLGESIRWFGTGAVAQDLDVLRAAVGDEQLSYLGLSYGTHIGEVYADRYPSRVRALALDGAVDPHQSGDDLLGLLRSTLRASERALTRFLAWCAADQAQCGFGGDDPRAALDALVDRLDAAPIVGATGTANGYTVVYGVFRLLTQGRAGWPGLGRALAALDAGVPALTNRALLDDPAQESAYAVVACTDAAGGVTREAYLRVGERIWDRVPTFGPALLAGPPTVNATACADWPVEAPESDWRGDFRAQGAAPVLVVGSTGDTVTPYSGALRATAAFDSASLLTFAGEGHVAVVRSPCVAARVGAYLVDLALPEPGARCVE